MTAPRIAFPFVGDTIGGSHFSTLLLIQQLPNFGYSPRVVVHERGRLSDHLDETEIAYDILPLPHLLRAGGGLRPLIDLLRLSPILCGYLKENNIALAHGNDGRVNQTWAVPTRLSGRSYVWHQRARFDNSRLRRLIAERSSAVLCVSEFARSRLPTPSMRQAANVIRNPFDTQAAPPDRNAARQALLDVIGVSGDVLVVGFCGSLTEQKRPDLFVDAAATLAAGHPNIHFVMMGTDRDDLWPAIAARTQSLGIDDRVHFIGFRSPAIYWLSSFDLLIAAQVEDAFPRVLVEAMLAGTPIVASQSGGHGEIIDDRRTGMLVPAEDAVALAKAGKALLDNPAFARTVTDAARRDALRRYSLQAHASTVARIYDGLLGRSRAETQSNPLPAAKGLVN